MSETNSLPHVEHVHIRKHVFRINQIYLYVTVWNSESENYLQDCSVYRDSTSARRDFIPSEMLVCSSCILLDSALSPNAQSIMMCTIQTSVPGAPVPWKV